ncbi:MAG: hypothetical protein M3N93_03045 [Acidobacteriota bacterium]|nr:hypothetical protein [Acidobacteriota bacterium]
MNKLTLFGALTAMAGLSAVAQAKDFTGEIMDSSCAKMGSHTQMKKTRDAGREILYTWLC